MHIYFTCSSGGLNLKTPIKKIIAYDVGTTKKPYRSIKFLREEIMK